MNINFELISLYTLNFEISATFTSVTKANKNEAVHDRIIKCTSNIDCNDCNKCYTYTGPIKQYLEKRLCNRKYTVVA